MPAPGPAVASELRGSGRAIDAEPEPSKPRGAEGWLVGGGGPRRRSRAPKDSETHSPRLLAVVLILTVGVAIEPPSPCLEPAHGGVRGKRGRRLATEYIVVPQSTEQCKLSKPFDAFQISEVGVGQNAKKGGALVFRTTRSLTNLRTSERCPARR